MNRRGVRLLIISIFVTFILGYSTGHRYCAKHRESKTDTVTIVETKIIKQPVAVSSQFTRTDFATFTQTQYVPLFFSDTISDSIRVAIPIEQITYEEEDYRAVVEGFRPRLVELELRPKTTTITQRVAESPKGWNFHFGPTVAYGWTPKGWLPLVGLGATATYNF